MRDPCAECARFRAGDLRRSPRSPSRLADTARRLVLWTAAAEGRHGFTAAGTASDQHQADGWVVVEDAQAGESLLVGGDLGAGVLRFGLDVEPTTAGVRIRAGANPPVDGRAADPDGTIEPAAGHAVEAPLTFLTLAEGGPDEVGNETFRYLKRHVLPQPVTGTPLAAYCVWLTDPDSEQILNEETRLREASRLRRVLPRCVLGGGQLHGARHERLGAGAWHL